VLFSRSQVGYVFNDILLKSKIVKNPEKIKKKIVEYMREGSTQVESMKGGS
jgi:hypothetical protein